MLLFGIDRALLSTNIDAELSVTAFRSVTLSQAESVDLASTVTAWIGTGLLVTGLGMICFAGLYLALRYRTRRGAADGLALGDFTASAVAESAAASLLSFLPGSAGLGGIVAGYFASTGSHRAASNGAASGAYYTVLPSDTIYAERSSMVGHIGVIASFTGSDGVPAPTTSGPDKATGGTIDQFRAQLETLKQSFVQSALNERGEEIDLSRTEISQAKIYIGARAVENGYADEIGGLESAIDDAASKAGLSSYRTTDRNPAKAPTVALTLGGSNTTQPTKSPFGTPGVNRVKYLAFWGQPTDNETGVITDVGS